MYLCVCQGKRLAKGPPKSERESAPRGEQKGGEPGGLLLTF